MSPALTVVVCTLGRAEPDVAAASVLASAERAGAAVQVVVVWQAAEPPHSLPEPCEVVESFPVNLSHARNAGLTCAGAGLVSFVDDDEQVDPGYVAGALAAFEDAAVEAAFGPVAPLDERGLPYCRFEAGGTARRFSGPGTPPWAIGTGGNMAFRTATLRRIGGFDLRLGAGSPGLSGEDHDVIARLQDRGAALLWTPDMVVYHPTKSAEERLAARRPYGFGMGRVAVRRRSPRLARQTAMAVAYAGREAIRQRSRRRARELVRTTRGIVAGTWQGRRWPAPPLDPETLPEAIGAAVGDRVLEPLDTPHRGDPHFLYAAGTDRILHLYAAPTAGMRTALEARRTIAARVRLDGVPELHAAAEAQRALWIVEDRMDGRVADPRRVGDWWAPLVAWAVALGRAAGPPLREIEWWAWAGTALPGAAGARWREPVARALETLGPLASMPAHGDLQPKNVFVAGPRVAVVDWEYAQPAFPPGYDLVFLATMAGGDRPRPAVLRELAAGRDPVAGPLLGPLQELGIGARELPALLLVALAAWTKDEAQRLARPGVAPQAPMYAPMLDELGPLLVAGRAVAPAV